MATHVSSAACLSVPCQRKIHRVRAVTSEDFAAVKTNGNEKVKLGASDLKVTRLGIGAWSWGDTSYWNNFEWDGNFAETLTLYLSIGNKNENNLFFWAVV